MKKVLLILSMMLIVTLFLGCNGANSTIESFTYEKICYIEDGRYYYLTNSGNKEMNSTYLDSQNLSVEVRQFILDIKEFPCEVYFKRSLSGAYVEAKTTPTTPKGDINGEKH